MPIIPSRFSLGPKKVIWKLKSKLSIRQATKTRKSFTLSTRKRANQGEVHKQYGWKEKRIYELRVKKKGQGDCDNQNFAFHNEGLRAKARSFLFSADARNKTRVEERNKKNYET